MNRSTRPPRQSKKAAVKKRRPTALVKKSPLPPLPEPTTQVERLERERVREVADRYEAAKERFRTRRGEELKYAAWGLATKDGPGSNMATALAGGVETMINELAELVDMLLTFAPSVTAFVQAQQERDRGNHDLHAITRWRTESTEEHRELLGALREYRIARRDYVQMFKSGSAERIRERLPRARASREANALRMRRYAWRRAKDDKAKGEPAW